MSTPAEMFLKHVANVIAERSAQYGDASAPWRPRRPLVGDAGPAVTPAQVVLCLIDLKLARLAHDPTHEDSAVDVCGYAALLREVTS